jgi:hypothetical protein
MRTFSTRVALLWQDITYGEESQFLSRQTVHES